MLLVTLLLRCSALVFNVVQARLFARLAKDIVYRIRVRLIERLKRISGVRKPGQRHGHHALVTDLDTLDKFVGETLSRFLVAMLTLVGTSAILVWMHWQLALLILLFNPLVIYATVQLGKRVKHLKKLETTAPRASPRPDGNPRCHPGSAPATARAFLGRLGQRPGSATTRFIPNGKPTPPAVPACCSSSASTSSARRRCSPCCFPTCPSARCSRCSVTCGS
jgi:ATP-binding cassette subfamily C protein